VKRTDGHVLAVLAAALVMATLLLTGCTGSSGTAASGPPAPMALEERAALLPPGFPAEVPVIAGTVVTTGGRETEKGRGVWTYTIDTTATAEAVESWYSTGLTGLNWDPQMPQGSPGSTSILREFTKGDGGQVIVKVTPNKAGGSRVEASVSLGVPVTPAQ
jgi:hypothetical protein